jgi:hypothetical protein
MRSGIVKTAVVVVTEGQVVVQVVEKEDQVVAEAGDRRNYQIFKLN